MFRRTWSGRSKVLLVLALASGIGAFAIVRSEAARLDALAPATGAPSPMVVAAHALPRGTVLSEAAVELVQVPAAFLPPGAIRSIDDVIGQTLVSDIAEGEALTRTRIGSAGGPVASQVPTGFRAFLVPSGMPTGSVRPGDRVDVLATFGGQRPYTDTVGTGLEILSVIEAEGSGLLASGGESGPTLVLLVTPDAAERLAYAKAFADLTVTIAGPQA
jgi:pilus assembly protein CpaB